MAAALSVSSEEVVDAGVRESRTRRANTRQDRHSEGKVALVTGAGRGIGAAIATAASEAGAAVAVLDLDGGAAAAMAAALPTKAIGVAADITDSAAVAAAVADAVDALGPIDVLVNNAGWDKIEPFLDNDESDWDKILNINLKGPIIVTRCRRRPDDRTPSGRDREHRVGRRARRIERRGGLFSCDAQH